MWALGRAASRELLWGLRATSREIRAWRARAELIPSDPIREDALGVLRDKRTHAHGAALFWTIPNRRNPVLLRLLVAYELIWDYLDNVNERAAAAGVANGRQLHLAISEAIDPGGPVSDYFGQHPLRDDGGYLHALVHACRASCLALPSYPRVAELALREANRAQVLALNHDPDPHRRDGTLKQWAAVEHADAPGAWWELSGAASAPLTIHALLALAAEPDCPRAVIDRVYAAYCPCLSATTTMLDSYVDQFEDIENGDHSYVSHYRDEHAMLQGISKLVRAAVREARSLPHGHRHAVIAAAMIAMYLSKDTARSPQLRAGTAAFIGAGGSLTQLLLPILQLWRIAYAQRSA